VFVIVFVIVLVFLKYILALGTSIYVSCLHPERPKEDKAKTKGTRETKLIGNKNKEQIKEEKNTTTIP